ncbi:MAG: hypothetical protein R3C28_13680 [Pirellulaceae bacterium]
MFDKVIAAQRMASQPHVPADGVLAAADGFVLSAQGIAQRIGRTIVQMECN